MIPPYVTGVVELTPEQLTAALKYLTTMRVIDVLDEDCVDLLGAIKSMKETLKELSE